MLKLKIKLTNRKQVSYHTYCYQDQQVFSLILLDKLNTQRFLKLIYEDN